MEHKIQKKQYIYICIPRDEEYTDATRSVYADGLKTATFLISFFAYSRDPNTRHLWTDSLLSHRCYVIVIRALVGNKRQYYTLLYCTAVQYEMRNVNR